MPSNTLDHVRRTGLHIALVTFGILALELALIRWIGTQVRVFAYFNNLVLIATFLGLKALVLAALAIYLAALWVVMRRDAPDAGT